MYIPYYAYKSTAFHTSVYWIYTYSIACIRTYMYSKYCDIVRIQTHMVHTVHAYVYYLYNVLHMYILVLLQY